MPCGAQPVARPLSATLRNEPPLGFAANEGRAKATELAPARRVLFALFEKSGGGREAAADDKGA